MESFRRPGLRQPLGQRIYLRRCALHEQQQCERHHHHHVAHHRGTEPVGAEHRCPMYEMALCHIRGYLLRYRANLRHHCNPGKKPPKGASCASLSTPSSEADPSHSWPTGTRLSGRVAICGWVTTSVSRRPPRWYRARWSRAPIPNVRCGIMSCPGIPVTTSSKTTASLQPR